MPDENQRPGIQNEMYDIIYVSHIGLLQHMHYHYNIPVIYMYEICLNSCHVLISMWNNSLFLRSFYLAHNTTLSVLSPYSTFSALINIISFNSLHFLALRIDSFISPVRWFLRSFGLSFIRPSVARPFIRSSVFFPSLSIFPIIEKQSPL